MRDALGDVGAAVVGHDESASRNQVHEALESGLDHFEIGVDVGVIEFNVGEDDCVRKVMEKFWPLVKEGGVVLVAFHDESAGGPQLKAGAEIFSDTADEEGWLKRGIVTCGHLEDPGQHAGGGGFAVSAGDH